MSAVYLTKDLLFSSQVTSAASVCGLDISVVSGVEALMARVESGDVHLVLLDYGTPHLDLLDLVPRIRATSAEAISIVAFGPHVNVAGLAAARQAGCDGVYTRGQFSRQLVDILGRYGCTT